MSKAMLKLAAAISRELLSDYNDYLAQCENDRKNGYRPHYCEHGTSNWTDYDNICGPCEDGISMGDGVFRREFAIDSAKRKMEAVSEITNAITTLRSNRVEIDLDPVIARISAILKP